MEGDEVETWAQILLMHATKITCFIKLRTPPSAESLWDEGRMDQTTNTKLRGWWWVVFIVWVYNEIWLIFFIMFDKIAKLFYRVHICQGYQSITNGRSERTHIPSHLLWIGRPESKGLRGQADRGSRPTDTTKLISSISNSVLLRQSKFL